MLRIFSIFNTIDGEQNAFGGPGEFSTFVRLYGCNLRCWYCDSMKAVDGGEYKEFEIETLVNKLISMEPNKLTFTGGEPLLQGTELLEVCKLLIEHNSKIRISIETSGSFDWPLQMMQYPSNIRMVCDFKTPSSGRKQWKQDIVKRILHLRNVDLLKIVFDDNPIDKTAIQFCMDCLFVKTEISILNGINNEGLPKNYFFQNIYYHYHPILDFIFSNTSITTWHDPFNVPKVAFSPINPEERMDNLDIDDLMTYCQTQFLSRLKYPYFKKAFYVQMHKMLNLLEDNPNK